MDIRQRILNAAARVYAKHGYRGSTTRLIAIEADVNEVTLFRTFGSKDALFQELARGQADATRIPDLPASPVDPHLELTRWCAAVLGYMTQQRSFLRKSLSELEDRPLAAEAACKGPQCAGPMLAHYVATLREAGMVQAGGDVEAAISMFMASLFGDAMCRDMMPHAFPEPAAEAPARYVHCFLRAIGISSAGAMDTGATAA